MKRLYSNEIKANQKVNVSGWVHEKRDLGNLIFLTLRDREGMVQITAKKGSVKNGIISLMKKINKESLISVKGKTTKNKKAPSGIEIIPSDVEVIAEAEYPLPIDIGKIESNFDRRQDWKFLDMRRSEILSIFKLQSKIIKFLNDFMNKEGFVRIFSSRLTQSATEGGTDYFPIMYFNKEAFLAQSPQLYKEAVLASGLDKVYEIGFVYRAEPHHTPRHLCEYISYDYEMISESMDEIMNLEEELIKYLFERINKECGDILGIYKTKLKIPNKIPRISLKEANKILKKLKVETDREDLTPAGEKAISEYCKKKYGSSLVFITGYPWKAKPFYTKKNSKDPKTAESFDLLFRGIEITTGGQREHRYKERTKNMKEMGLNPKDFDHLRFFKYGMPPHGGLAIGMERLIMKILNLGNIREASLTPRDPERLTP
jgi:aspartyl-tRNA synthetase